MVTPSTHTLIMLQRQMLLIEHEWQRQAEDSDTPLSIEELRQTYSKWPALSGTPLGDSFAIYQIMEELNLLYGFPQNGTFLFKTTPRYEEWLSLIRQGTFVRQPPAEPAFASLSENLAGRQLTDGRVFIVHGEDARSENSLHRDVSQFIRSSFGYEPVMLDIGGKPGVVFNHFENEAALCSAAVCIWTPDRDDPEGGSIRPNVMLETGYFIAHLGLHRVIIIQHSEVKHAPSDLGGQTFLTEHTWQSHLAQRIYVAMADLIPATSSG